MVELALALLIAQPTAAHELPAHAVPLPGDAPISMDYLAVDPATGFVWVPAGSSGRIDVLDPKSGKVHAIEGVATAKRGDRTTGATAVSPGEGVVYVGNRADSSVCAYDARTFARKGCVTLPSTPDGVCTVAATHQVWVTLPREQALAVVDVSKADAPKLTGTFKVAGSPEGYAVDAAGGVFYTNLEDKDRTLGISLKTHQVVSDWPAGCGEAGPRGLVWDGAHHRVTVACTDKLEVLDAAHGGKVLSKLEVGSGVDNIDWLAAKGRVYAASGKLGKVTVAQVDEAGQLSAVATAKVAEGCRNVVAGADGVAYAPDSRGGKLWVVAAP